jgi:outer membrane biosynthesis protein TonB
LDLAVNRLLAERSRRGSRAAEAACLALATLLHLAVAAAIALFSRLAPLPPRLDYVAVQVIPAQPLDVLNPPGEPLPAPHRALLPEPPAAPQQRSEPPLQSPGNPEKRQPKPEPGPSESFAPTTRPALLPPPPETLAQGLGNRAGAGLEDQSQSQSPSPYEETPGRGDGPRGLVSGSVAADSSLDRFAVQYQMYLISRLMKIYTGLQRSPTAPGTHTVVFFYIQRDGSITDLKLCETSGIDVFDLAVLREVRGAALSTSILSPRLIPEDPVGLRVVVTPAGTGTRMTLSTGC